MAIRHSDLDPFSAAWAAQVAADCRDDSFFLEKSESFVGRISLQSDSAAVHFDIRPAHVESGAGWPPDTTIGVRGTAADWRPILDGLPGGLHRAWREKRLEFVAEPAVLMDGYLVLFQLGERVAESFGARG